jgi:hypothetical protein
MVNNQRVMRLALTSREIQCEVSKDILSTVQPRTRKSLIDSRRWLVINLSINNSGESKPLERGFLNCCIIAFSTALRVVYIPTHLDDLILRVSVIITYT